MNSNLLTIQERAANIMKSISCDTQNIDLNKGGLGSGRKKLKYGDVIGKTGSGKEVKHQHEASHEHYKNFNATDHYQAAMIHIMAAPLDGNKKQNEEHHELANQHFKEYHKLKKNIMNSNLLTVQERGQAILKAFQSDILKAEGSRGGKVIGHTKSGKPIYSHFAHEGHKNFSEQDHNDAAKIHSADVKYHKDIIDAFNKKPDKDTDISHHEEAHKHALHQKTRHMYAAIGEDKVD